MKYVLITPAKNEEDYIELTINSVISQTLLPEEWIIVSDGSTDKTDEIVREFTKKYSWLKLVRTDADKDERQFASKVFAFNKGYESLSCSDYDIIGNLDADISFSSQFMSGLIARFEENPMLGVAGAPFVEKGFQSYSHNYTNFDHVSGACQLFRKKCFEQIGGYIPIKGGGIDWTAVTTARMKGWQTRTFPDYSYLHHRPIGTGNANSFRARINQGVKDFYLGGHPLWEFFRGLFQMKSKPYVIGGMLLFWGYCWAWIKGMKSPISGELKSFHRKEQLSRLKTIFMIKGNT